MPDPIQEYTEQGDPIQEYDAQGNAISATPTPTPTPTPQMTFALFNGQPIDVDEGPSLWERANTPLTTLPSKAAGWINQNFSTPEASFQAANQMIPGAGDFGRNVSNLNQGVMQGLGNIGSDLTSPLNLAFTGSGLGELAAAKAGLPLVSQGFRWGTRGLSGLVGLHGTHQIVTGETTGDKLGGALELGMGIAGLYHQKPNAWSRSISGGGASTAEQILDGIARKHGWNSPEYYQVINGIIKQIRSNPETTPEMFNNVNDLLKLVRERSKSPKPFQNAVQVGQVPSTEAINPNKPTVLREMYDFARGTSAAFDISAPFRQGIGLVGTKNWFKAWVPMFKALGSENAYKNVTAAWRDLEYVKSGMADDAGLALTDLNKALTKREEILQSTWAEKIPGVRASNRAYTAYLNDLRARTFNDLMRDAVDMGIDVKNNTPYARKLAEFVNDATGRGKLELSAGNLKSINLEDSARFFNDVFFSPRLMASRVRMLNPGTYIMAPPQIRQQYLKSLLRMGAAWATFAELGKTMGGEVETDPESADFGKIKFGDTRIDPAGGFQQYLVAAARMATGRFTSSTTGKSATLGRSYKARTRFDVNMDFMLNKLHPSARFAVDLLRASRYKPFNVADRTAQMYVPMIIGDLTNIAKTDPDLLPAGMVSAIGMGAQTYEKGQSEPVFVPEEKDWQFTGGPLGFEEQ